MNIEISFENIDRVQEQLKQYMKSYTKKLQKFVELLLEKGITVAETETAKGSHQLPQRIRFEKKIEADKGYVLGILTGKGDTLISDWIDAKGNEHIDEVFPLSMLEFGSAAYALEPQDTFGGHGGKGTFSVSGNENKASWYVTKIDDGGNEIRKHATAIEPTKPMYNAMLDMRSEISECAEKAFRS